MENNKILIGICFYKSDKENSKIEFEDYSIELVVLRDITFQSLYDGIKWGLKKKGINLYENLELVTDENDKLLTIADKKIWISNHIRKKDNNGKPIDIKPYQLDKIDFFKKICDLGFVSSTRIIFSENQPNFNSGININSIIPAFKDIIKFPKYNISSRQLQKIDKTPIDIIPPSEPPKKNNQSFLMMLLPSLLLILVTILIRGSFSSNSSMIILSLAMSIVTLITSIINHEYQNSNYKKELKFWKETYSKYIEILIKRIIDRRAKTSAKLNEIYPNITDILGDNFEYSVFKVTKNIFSRSPQDSDFLTVRLGISNMIETPFEINGTKQNTLFSQATFTINGDKITINLNEDKFQIDNASINFLSNLPNEISNKYKYLENAPLLLPLKDCGSLGIVSNNTENCKQMIDNILFELCYYHSPENLQIIILFEETSKDDKNSKIEHQIYKYKFMPHFRELFNDKSSFVFNKQDADDVFSNLLEIMNTRQNNQMDNLPHIVLVIYEEYGLKEHAFAKYLPKPPQDNKDYVDKLGITFIFSKKYEEHLPNYCRYTININQNSTTSAAKLTPRENSDNLKEFIFSNPTNKDTICDAYTLLSTLNYSKISQNSRVPSNVSIYELFGINGNSNQNNLNDVLEKYWKNTNNTKDVTKSLAVPIGKTEDKVTLLDLHEKSDGPHMLVAGTTGSGKSETIISYLIGLCIKFRPDEINLMLVDMKGEGFVGRIGSLPHVVGKVTDVDDDESGVGAEYMLKRFLNSLTSEIKRRKSLFKKMSVDSIDKYIFSYNNLDKHIKDNLSEMVINYNDKKCTISELLNDGVSIEKICSCDSTLKTMQEICNNKEQKLAHLILVVDEFTELKRFSSENSDIDFIGEITTIARIGRSLGLHIILISQNIEGAITEDIRVNSKARLCLKVATRTASKEMIHTDLAASPSMPGNGRAYLLVGTGSRFEYFQSAYSGASASSNNEVPIEITEASKTGKYTTFYNSYKDNEELLETLKADRKTQLSVIVNGIKSYYTSDNYTGCKPHIVFQPPLPKRAIYENNKFIDISNEEKI